MTELPKGWITVDIGALCDLKNGRAFKPNDWTDKGKKIVRIQNLNNPKAHYNHFDGDVRERFKQMIFFLLGQAPQERLLARTSGAEARLC
jgi:hypothetical protein